MASVTLRNVSKRFRDQLIIDAITLEIPDGAFAVLVGPSGSGKSTILRLIAGLEEPTQGEIWIGDECVNDRTPPERGIAMVFQSYALYPHMSVYQNLAFGLERLGSPKAEIDGRVREAARILQIEPLLGRKPRELSGGQRQRVAVGRAIVRKPRVFLFDEPLSNLDASLRVHMRLELARLHQELAVTTIYVTHDQAEAMTLADTIAVVNRGRIEQVGKPLQLYETPQTTFVAGFIGSPPMNLIEGCVIEETGDVMALSLPSGERLRLPISAAHPATGAIVTLGIRPEHFIEGTGPDCLTASVQAVERLGNETLVHVRLRDGTLLTWWVPGETALHAGATVALGVAPERCHLFDAEGKAFPRPGGSASAAAERARSVRSPRS